ncbi:hypothetical protein F5890DRAFT_1478302 [Lentinula detonsa]|uniref:Uncharacterized protein n=1 Tax=Lentinula detonsa TaxID=2804962 RepID=A0AA38PQG6_9AGAR|nr:hypothetical protein F5890DRAFT_1478302 [Lentinula detonsa]
MSPLSSKDNSPSDDEERAEELRLQKKREEREKEEKKRREAEEKRKEEEAKKKREEEEQQKRKEEEEKKKREEEEEANRAKSVGALVQASIARRGKENHPIDVDSSPKVGKKRKRIAMIASNGDPEGDDPNPGDDGEDSESDSDEYKEQQDEDEEESEKAPTPTPTLHPTPRKALKKARVKCSLVGSERTFRRSKRLKREDSMVASTSSERFDALEESNRELSRRLSLMEDMVRFIVQTIRPVDANEESEEDRVRRTGDVKGKGRKE